MAQLPQAKTGYLKGIRGLVVIPLNADGSMPGTVTRFGVKTAQNAGVEPEVVDGESSELRGGDRVLARQEEDDIVVGMNLSFVNAKFDAKATQIIAGGTLIETAQGADTVITGWKAPTITEQATKTPFQAEVYVANYNASGGVDGFLKYTFPYCKGSVPSVEHGDQEWGADEFEMKARENPSTAESYMRKEFVTALPAELQ